MRLSGFILACFLVGCSSGNRYQVSGNLVGGGDATVRLLKYTGQSKYVTVDSAQMKSGRFRFRGTVKHPVNVILGVGDAPYNFGFWLENSRIRLTAPADSVYRARVLGSAADLENLSIRKFLAPYDENCRRLANEAARATNETEKNRLVQMVDSCWENKKQAIIHYIKEHPASYPAASLIKSISYALTWQELEEIINGLSDAVAASEEVQVYKSRVEQLKTVDIGKKAPDFSVPDTMGVLVNAYQELRKNKLTLIDFWASWCGPCRRENPNLVKAYQRFHEQGFGIIGVSLDKTKADWVKAIKADGLGWTHVSNLRYWDDPVVKQYAVNSVPANVLLDAEGNIVARNLKGEALLDFLESHLQPVRKLEISGLDKPVNYALSARLPGTEGRVLLTGNDSAVIAYQIKGTGAVPLFTVPIPGSVQQLAVMDMGAGDSALIAVTGQPRNVDNVNVEVYIISRTAKGWAPSRIYVRNSPRPQINLLASVDMNRDGESEILVSYFESKYDAETVLLSRNAQGGWDPRVLDHRRMASAPAVGTLPGYDYPVRVVGRPYGDSLGLAGDLYLMSDHQRPEKSVTTILPSFRGVRAVELGDGDNDGRNEIYVGDGWHQDYGKIARGRLAVVAVADTGFSYRLIEDIKGQYGVSQIVVADITGDGRNELIVGGNRYLRIYRRSGENWEVFCDEKVKPGPFAVGDINNDGHPDLLLSGKEGVRVYNFRNLPFVAVSSKELITEVVKPAELVGRPAPELQIDHWYNGAPVSLAALKGKVVLLDFWATWCKPCIKLFPQLKGWQEKYGKEGLVVLGLTREDDNQKLPDIERFIQNENFAYRIGVSEESLNNLAYGVGGIPHVVLIDRKGIVRQYKVGAGEHPEFEAALLKCLQE